MDRAADDRLPAETGIVEDQPVGIDIVAVELVVGEPAEGRGHDINDRNTVATAANPRAEFDRRRWIGNDLGARNLDHERLESHGEGSGKAGAASDERCRKALQRDNARAPAARGGLYPDAILRCLHGACRTADALLDRHD